MEMLPVESSGKKPGKRKSKISNETEEPVVEPVVEIDSQIESNETEEPVVEIDSQILQIRSEIKEYEETIKAIERGDKFSVPGKKAEDFHTKIVEAENRLREIENSKAQSEIDSQILQIRSEIKEYEETIKAIERGDKFSVPGKKAEDFHTKIVEAENRLREIENSKTKSKPKNEQESEIVEETPLEAPEISTPNEITLSDKSIEELEENLETEETIPEDFFEKQEASETIYTSLEDARNSFIVEYHKHLKEKRDSGALAWVRAKLGIARKENESELPEALNSARQMYDESKITYAKELAAQLQERGASFAEINAEVYDRIILNEYSLRKQAEAELWTPKEKGVIRKSLDWYMKQNRFVRVGVSSAILTGAIVTTGGLGAVAGSAVFAGRYIRGLVSVTTGQLAGVGFDKVFKDRTEERLEQSIEDQRRGAIENAVSYQDPLQQLHDMEKRLEETYSKTESDKRKRLLAKSAVMLAATLGANAGLEKLEELYQSAPLPINPVPKPESITPVSVSVENVADTPSIEEIPPINPFEVSSTNVIITPDANNLWSAIKMKLQSEGLLTLLETSGQQTHMVDQVYNVFEKMTPEQLKAIGITSGNIQKVMTGSTIDLSLVFGKPELLGSMFDGSTELAQQTIANIEAQGRVISAFQAVNPKTLLTPELIKQIVAKARL